MFRRGLPNRLRMTLCKKKLKDLVMFGLGKDMVAVFKYLKDFHRRLGGQDQNWDIKPTWRKIQAE